MPGFEENRFYDLPEIVAKHMCCGICMNVFDNAITTDCGHSFCKECLQNTIENYDNNECPQCKAHFTRKRGRVGDNHVIIGLFVFKPNYTVNGFIDDLEVKCEFEFNGCKVRVKLGSIKDHIKDCEHRICHKCGYKSGNIESHNCIEILKTAINEMQRQRDQYMKERDVSRKELIDMKKKMELLESDRDKKERIINELKVKINTLEIDAIVNHYLKGVKKL